MEGTGRLLYCHTLGYLPCRSRNIDVIIAVTSTIVCLVYGLFGCYFYRLQIKAAGISASWLSSRSSVTETHWRVQRRHSRCQTHRHFSQYSFSSPFYNFIHDLELIACHAKLKLLWKNKSGYCGLISTTVSLWGASCLTSRPGSDALTWVFLSFPALQTNYEVVPHLHLGHCFLHPSLFIHRISSNQSALLSELSKS